MQGLSPEFPGLKNQRDIHCPSRSSAHATRVAGDSVTFVGAHGASLDSGYLGVLNTVLVAPKIPWPKDSVNKTFEPCFTVNVD